MAQPLRHVVTVEQLRRCSSAAIERVVREGHRVLVMRYGRPLAAIVSMADLEQLERGSTETTETAPDLLELFLAWPGR